ncbi:NAD+ synthase [Roseospirillum parvum]|uniref:Glutamine-dependent NAD(+) synthetase n=1 Tax=Roseospirillum parvum TaxID=83401 RepID=A0A1G8CKB5_9PROT|nr:NAD+ synthase [Roseospirillum parvum]SDH45872.1 NAD+ synthase [Roseospirillum parvum]
MSSLTVVMAQVDPTVGDLDANLAMLRAARAEAAGKGADLVVFPELALAGYPPEDLVLRAGFRAACRAHAEALAADTADGGPAVIVGLPVEGPGGLPINAAMVLDGGRVVATVGKRHLPNYGVFDEARVFAPAAGAPQPVSVRGWRLGVMICEDMWFPDVAAGLAAGGADLLVVPNGSPFEVDKGAQRLGHARARVAETGLPLLYVNQVGGQDELVFDGASFAVAADGRLIVRGPSWQSASLPVVFDPPTAPGATAPVPRQGAIVATAERCEDIYRALMAGLAGYVDKNGFPGVVLGLSGGIDSALSAAVAVDALGPERVRCLMMPSPHTSRESLEDAAGVVRLLGCRLDEVPIGGAMETFDGLLRPLFEDRPADVTEENIQARARALILMAVSNKFGHMLLSTGNKSEMSVGYATLYGDMCGGFNVLKDVYKTTVFALSRWRNAHWPPAALGPDGPVMPQRVIDKPPSAELRPDQKDSDSLPDYPVLDAILKGLIEGEMGLAQMAAAGHDPADVARVWRLLLGAEYKRRQAPPGVKITLRSFGRERRYPMTNAFRGEH